MEESFAEVRCGQGGQGINFEGDQNLVQNIKKFVGHFL